MNIEFKKGLPTEAGAYLYRPNKNFTPVWVWLFINQCEDYPYFFNVMQPGTIPSESIFPKDISPDAEFAELFIEAV